MPRDISRRKKRDEKVRELFEKVFKKNPKWRTECVIQEVADMVFLAPKTVEDIVKCNGIYAID